MSLYVCTRKFAVLRLVSVSEHRPRAEVSGARLVVLVNLFVRCALALGEKLSREEGEDILGLGEDNLHYRPKRSPCTHRADPLLIQ